jgi:hypothetical protein
MSNEKDLSNAHTDALNLQNRLRIEKIEEAVEGTLSIIEELKDLTISSNAFEPIVELIKCTNERIDTHNKQIFDLLSVVSKELIANHKNIENIHSGLKSNFNIDLNLESEPETT